MLITDKSGWWTHYISLKFSVKGVGGGGAGQIPKERILQVMKRQTYCLGPRSRSAVALTRAWTRWCPSGHVCLLIYQMRLMMLPPSHRQAPSEVQSENDLQSLPGSGHVWQGYALVDGASRAWLPRPSPFGPARWAQQASWVPFFKSPQLQPTRSPAFPNPLAASNMGVECGRELYAKPALRRKSIYQEWFISPWKKLISKWNNEFPDSHLQGLEPPGLCPRPSAGQLACSAMPAD